MQNVEPSPELHENTAVLTTTVAERQLLLDERRFALEVERERQSRRWNNKYLGLVIASIISTAGIFVSAVQIEVAKISRDSETERATHERDRDAQRASEEKARDLQRIAAEKQSDLALESAKQAQEWDIRLATFVAENKETLFGTDSDVKERLHQLILVTFPRDKATEMFDRLAAHASDKVWTAAKDEANALASVAEAKQVLAQLGYFHDASDNNAVDQPFTDALKRFQADTGAPVSGIIGPKTTAALRRPR